MALYFCPKCGETFDVPLRKGRAGESRSACPSCGSPDFEEAWQCRGCRADLAYNQLIAGEYCPDCIERALATPELVREYMSLPDVRENFAEYLAERQWEPWR